MESQPKKILIKEPNWVGDNIFTLPAVQQLREMYPRARLSILVKSGVAPLWELVPQINEIIGYDLRGGLKDIKRKWELIRTLRRKGFDLAIIFPRSFESALWMRLAGIFQRWGYREEWRSFLLTRRKKSARGYRHTHRIDYYYQLVGDAESDAPAPLAHLEVPPRLLAWAREFIKKETGGREFSFLAGLHPRASHGPAKCWPLENYTRLAELLVREKGAAVLVFGREHEKEMARAVVRAAAPRAFNLAGRTDLKQLAALIKLCRVFVANDTGPLHIAAALGVPAVGIFGSSDPGATGPRGKLVRVIYKKVPCSPCLKRFCPTDFRCMISIAPEEVLYTIDLLLKDLGRCSPPGVFADQRSAKD